MMVSTSHVLSALLRQVGLASPGTLGLGPAPAIPGLCANVLTPRPRGLDLGVNIQRRVRAGEEAAWLWLLRHYQT